MALPDTPRTRGESTFAWLIAVLERHSQVERKAIIVDSALAGGIDYVLAHFLIDHWHLEAI